MWFHITEHERALAEGQATGQQQAGQQGGEQQQKVAESIGFKDLPPDGQVQMAAQAGIKLDPQAMQQMQMQQAQGQSSPKVGGGKSPKINVGVEKRSPTAAATPLKTAMNPSNNLINNNQQ